MKRILIIIKSQVIATLSFRLHFILTLCGNIVYMVLVFFLWKAIFSGRVVLNGMTFENVFLYITLTSALFCLYQTHVEWGISGDVINGNIIMHMIKPMDFVVQRLAYSLGFVISNLLIITIPSFLMIFITFGMRIPVGINILFFIPSIVLGFIISFLIDYMVGLTAFYTESIWGIIVTKEVIVTFLSGAVIPLAFFPEWIRNIVMLLPFQCIYNTPVSMLVKGDLLKPDYLKMLIGQIFWVVILIFVSKLFYRTVIRVVTVNGG